MFLKLTNISEQNIQSAVLFSKDSTVNAFLEFFGKATFHITSGGLLLIEHYKLQLTILIHILTDFMNKKRFLKLTHICLN